MKRKIFLFTIIFLVYLTSLTVSDGQSSDDHLPEGAIARFNPGASVYTVAFSPDGQLLASGGDDNAIILWNIADRSKQNIFIEHGKSVMSAAFSPDGQLLASASLDGFVRLWHVFSERNRTSLRHDGWVESVAFSPDGKMLVSGGGDQEGSVTLWDVSQKRHIAILPGHGGIVESVAFSPDGELIASASRDGTVKLWDVDSQHVRSNFTEHSNVVYAVAFSPNGEMFASSSRDNTINLWDVPSGEKIATLEIKNSLYAYAEALAFSPDGQLLAAGCVDYTIRLWNVVDGREVQTLTGHHGGVTSVAFSPDGQLASGSRDRTVLLWDLSYFGFEVPLAKDLLEEPDSPEVVPSENLSVAASSTDPEPLMPRSENLLHHQDTTPPEIVVRSPRERIVDSTIGQIPVKVSVSDDSRLVKVQINGRGASVLEEGLFSATIPLNQHRNDIRVTATDTHGNMGTHQFLIEKPYPILQDTTPPEIMIHSPTLSDTRLAVAEFAIEGRATDNNSISEVRVDDVGTIVAEDGTFTTTVQLFEGENHIRVTATDTSGNMDTNQFTIVRDTTGPDINIHSPAGGTERGFQPPDVLPTQVVLISGTVTDPSGVAEVKVNEMEVQVRGDTFETTVPSTDRNDFIRVTATDTLGNQAFEDIIIHRFPRPGPRTGKDYALLFAVDTYDHWPGLRFPLVDALNVSQDLEKIYGFQVELIENPTKADILRELHKYAQKEYEPEDQLLIFFAGHGDFDTVSNMGYLVSRDTKKPEDDNVRLSYFSHSYFRDFIDRMSCKHIFLVMDTCYSGTFDERLAMRGEAESVSASLSQVDIERIMTYTTRWYLTSGANERVPDDSSFIRALLDALRSKGGRDNTLTIKEILTYLEDLKDPKPCFDEFGRNAPGSDFLFIAK